MITVKDLIAHLHTLPQNLEVWETWDESGAYWPARKPPVRIDYVERNYKNGRWEQSNEPGVGKAVCVLLEE